MRRLAAAGLFLVLCVALASPTLAEGPSGAKSIEDTEYGFRLTSPGPSWRLISRESARLISPEMVAGLAHEGGLNGFVSVEKTAATDLESLARGFVERNRLQSKRVDLFERTEFAGRRAWRAVVTGLEGGRPFRSDYLMWIERDLFFQLVAAGPAGAEATSDVSFRTIQEAFEFLAAGPRPGRSVTVAADADGPTWRVRAGVFESASFGFAIEPRGPWRLSVGDELAALNEDAAAGLVCMRPPAFVVFIPEKIPAPLHAKHSEVAAADMARRATPVTGVSVPATIDGETILLDRYAEGGGREGHVFHGVLHRGDTALRVLATLRAKPDSATLATLGEAMAGVRFLESADRSALARDLDARGDGEAFVGPDHALRGGVYRDFSYGFSWRKPSAAFSARRLDPSEGPPATAMLEFEAESLGIEGYVFSERISAVPAAEYHRVNAIRLFGADGEASRYEAKETRLGEVMGLVSIGTRAAGPLPARCHLVTAVVGDRAFQMTVHGVEDNVVAAASEIEGAIRGFEIAARGLDAIEMTDGSVRDTRLGFELRRPAEGWKFRRGDSEELNERGGACGFALDSRQWIMLVVKALPGGRFDDDVAAQAFLADLPELALDHFGIDPVEGRETIAGMPCRRFTWQNGKERFDVLLFRRGATYWAYCVASHDGKPALEEAKSLVSLLP